MMRGALLCALLSASSAAAVFPTAALAPSIPANRMHGLSSANATAEPDDAQLVLSNVHTSILNGAQPPPPPRNSTAPSPTETHLPPPPAVTSDIETVEASKVIDAARLQSYYSAALQEIEENLSSLQRVRADVNATSKIDPAVKAQVCTRPRAPRPRAPLPSPPPPAAPQVLWNLDKMTDDVRHLHDSGLAPTGRAALIKALELRFSVLLSHAFWQRPVDRALLS